jgi:hypothetical protein
MSETFQARFIAGDETPHYLPRGLTEEVIDFADRAAAVTANTHSFYAFSRVEYDSGVKDPVLTQLVKNAISGQLNRPHN